MKYTAYLMILEREGVPFNEEDIHRHLLDMRFEEVRSFEAYVPYDTYGRFVVWRFDSGDKLTDEAARELVGSHGAVQYVWLCTKCNMRATRVEHPYHHEKDVQFSCCCPETAWDSEIC